MDAHKEELDNATKILMMTMGIVDILRQSGFDSNQVETVLELGKTYNRFKEDTPKVEELN